MDSSGKIKSLVTQALTQGIFSAAQVLVGRGRERLFFECYGKISEDPKSKAVDAKTLFDVASLTKPVVTAQLAMLAVQRGKLDLQTPIKDLLKGWNRPEPITFKHLLDHTSGLVAWHGLYEEGIGKAWSPQEAKLDYLSQIQRLPLVAEVGEMRIYSDCGYLLLGWILEEQLGKSLEDLFQEQIAKSLEMNSSFFNPLEKLQVTNPIAATEACSWREKTLQGQVHDDNAYLLGGIAGHAGLFSTALDLEKFIHGLWQDWQDPTLQNFVGSKIFPKLGWDTVSKPQSQAGKYFSEQTIGHLGYTGCSFWLDPEDQKFIIFLNNSVHPQRSKEAIQKFRPQLYDLLIEELGLA